MQSPIGGNRTIQNIEFNGSAPIGSIVNIGAGVSYTSERDQNERIGFFGNTAIQLSGAMSLDVRFERTSFSEIIPTDGNYREFVMTVGLSTRW